MGTQATMRSGTIELPSGRWYRTVTPRWTGAMVVFRHPDWLHDEVRSWIQEGDLTPALALQLARGPLVRLCANADG